MQNSVLAARFNEGLRDEAKLWLNQRLGVLWAAADWPFKKLTESCSVGGDGVVVPPSMVRRVLAVWNSDNDKLEWLEPQVFRSYYDGTETGTLPVAWTIDGEDMKIAPIGAGTVSVRHERRLYHLDENGDPVVGPLTLDEDSCPYDEEFHYYLVQGAIATGLKRENDPTWQALEDDFNAGIFVMREELLPPNSPENRQFDRQVWS